ncbi:MAG: 6-phospho-3-hexuloisomerase [Armatimonadetes bacterium]|nr:6-phospho-3-hexuloisomerase [Armatimonadota bacterium]
MPFSSVVPQEIAQVMARVSSEEVERLTQAIQEAEAVYVCGAGRSLLMMKAFAMRLVHLGLNAYVVGETITPAIERGHLLIAGTGSGQTRTTLAMVEAARERQARVAAITAHADSPVARQADLVVQIPAPVPGSASGPRLSQQPPGSLFEQCLLLLCDSIVMLLMDRLGVTEESMLSRHTKLE